MGQEANCLCAWNEPETRIEGARVKAVLEPPELILRGEIRRRIPFAQMKQVTAQGAWLRFRVDGEAVGLELGEDQAVRWAQKLLKPPPTLAQKLGIMAGCTVRVLGTIEDKALAGALKDTRGVARGAVDVIVARVDTAAEMRDAWKKAGAQVAAGAALWMVYPKGRGRAINETDVREAGLAAGFVDVKVAAVSADLTALKFVRRKNPK
jgi:hypothetical protein